MRVQLVRHARHRVDGKCIQNLVGKPQGKRQLGRYWYRMKDKGKWMFEIQGMKV
jgi:hypothetical protein